MMSDDTLTTLAALCRATIRALKKGSVYSAICYVRAILELVERDSCQYDKSKAGDEQDE